MIARQKNMVAINSALEIDLTGQTTSESLGKTFYSGIGGHANFMRGAILAPGGKTILAIQSTAEWGKVSRIVPFLQRRHGGYPDPGRYSLCGHGIWDRLPSWQEYPGKGHGVDLHRPSPISSLVDREGQAGQPDLPGPGLHPREKGGIPRTPGNLPDHDKGLQLLLRPVKISDEPLLKDFFYSLSDQSLYRRFISIRKDMPHERLQEFVVIDYTKEMVILATIREGEMEKVVGVGQYGINEANHTAEVSLVVRDDYQNQEIGTELLILFDLPGQEGGSFTVSPPRCWWKTGLCSICSKRWGLTFRGEAPREYMNCRWSFEECNGG